MSKQPPLFPDLPPGDVIPGPDRVLAEAPARVLSPVREQIELRAVDLEATVADDHPVRAVWSFVEGLDLSMLYAGIRSVEGQAGRPAIDPKILVALWLYATIDAVGSARRLARLCETDDVYRWICGGVSVNHHTLSDFRVGHEQWLNDQLTRSVAALMHGGLVELKRVAQDGMRVRASAGAASFRRRSSLNKCLRQARGQVKKLRAELDDDPSAENRRVRAAKARAAEEREQRVKQALDELDKIEQSKSKSKKTKKKPGESDEAHAKRTEPRASTTDPQARVMKMADGGFRPAFNVQFSTDVDSQIIVGVDITNVGSDMRLLPPMLEQLENRYETTPDDALVDAGFASHQAINDAEARGVTVYAPVVQPRNPEQDPHERRRKDSDAVARWRERMATDEAKQIYKERAASAECVNAIARGRGLQQFSVRGLAKAKAVTLWYAIAHNMVRLWSLPEPNASPG